MTSRCGEGKRRVADAQGSFTELQHHALKSENRPSALADSCRGRHDMVGRETDFSFQNLRRKLISHGRHDGALKRETDLQLWANKSVFPVLTVLGEGKLPI